MRRLLRQILAIERALFIVSEDVAESTLSETGIGQDASEKAVNLAIAAERREWYGLSDEGFMPSCLGKRKSGATCSSVVHRCEKCTNAGCDQDHRDECSNQGFRFGTCLKCGNARFLTAIELVQRLEIAIK
jgi:hypothetical protein